MILSYQQGNLYRMYWTYVNWVHKYAKVHRAECVFCNDGLGIHAAVDSQAGKWLGPFNELREAFDTSNFETSPCGFCSPR